MTEPLLPETSLLPETLFDAILVPQGAEAAAVQRGLKLAQASCPVIAIAMGPTPTTRRLAKALGQNQLRAQNRVLVLGVAGSLSPELGVGDIVIYANLLLLHKGEDIPPPGEVPPNELSVSLGRAIPQLENLALRQRLPQASFVTALSSDRLIHRASEKVQLHHSTHAQVVDMEAAAIQASLAPQEIEISTVRVISDGIDLDLPDTQAAITPAGDLDWGKMAIAMLRQPRASLNLITGSLKALKVLEQVTYQIFK
jgi:nucleoside phosphorylase